MNMYYSTVEFNCIPVYTYIYIYIYIYSHPQNIGSLYHRNQLFVLKQEIAGIEISYSSPKLESRDF